MRIKTVITVTIERDFDDCTLEDVKASVEEDPYVLMDDEEAIWDIKCLEV